MIASLFVFIIIKPKRVGKGVCKKYDNYDNHDNFA